MGAGAGLLAWALEVGLQGLEGSAGSHRGTLMTLPPCRLPPWGGGPERPIPPTGEGFHQSLTGPPAGENITLRQYHEQGMGLLSWLRRIFGSREREDDGSSWQAIPLFENKFVSNSPLSADIGRTSAEHQLTAGLTSADSSPDIGRPLFQEEKIICPKCGREGIKKVWRARKKYYVYVTHGNTKCYIGLADEKDI